jgi:hypothetical protein
MSRLIVRVIVRPLVGLVLGAAAAALYAGLVGAVHLSVYGRWDNIPTFAGGCVLVGSVLGLLIAAVLTDDAYNAERARGKFGPARTRPRSAAWPACSSLMTTQTCGGAKRLSRDGLQLARRACYPFAVSEREKRAGRV